mgnify:CR=1 FL=1
MKSFIYFKVEYNIDKNVQSSRKNIILSTNVGDSWNLVFGKFIITISVYKIQWCTLGWHRHA